MCAVRLWIVIILLNGSCAVACRVLIECYFHWSHSLAVTFNWSSYSFHYQLFTETLTHKLNSLEEKTNALCVAIDARFDYETALFMKRQNVEIFRFSQNTDATIQHDSSWFFFHISIIFNYLICFIAIDITYSLCVLEFYFASDEGDAVPFIDIKWIESND